MTTGPSTQSIDRRSTTRFERRAMWSALDKKHNHHYFIHCHVCGEEEELGFKSPRGLPDDVIAKKFTQKNWLIGTTRGSDLCPRCIKRLGSERNERSKLRAAATSQVAANLAAAQAAIANPLADLSRKTVILARREMAAHIDRMRSLMTEQVIISGMALQLLDRAGDIETRIRELADTMQGIPGVGHHLETDIVTNNMIGSPGGMKNTIAAVEQRVEGEGQLFVAVTAQQSTKFILNDHLARIMGFALEKQLRDKDRPRCNIIVGAARADGLVGLERAPEGNLGVPAKSSITFMTSRLWSDTAPVLVPMPAKFDYDRAGGLVVHLPDAFGKARIAA